MKVVSFKVDLREYKEIVKCAEGMSVASFIKRVVFSAIGLPIEGFSEGRPTDKATKVDLRNKGVTGRPIKGNLTPLYEEVVNKKPAIAEFLKKSKVSTVEVEIDPEKLAKFKDKWGR